MDDGCRLVCPVPRQRLDRPDGHAAFFAGPLRRLGLPVLPAQHVLLKLVEAVGVGGDIIPVVSALCDPEVGNGELERHIRVGQHGDPLVPVDRRAVVQIRAHVNGLQADLREPGAQPGGHVADDAQRRSFRIAAPEQEQIGVFRNIRVQVRLRRHLAHGLTAPDVFCAPEPPLPGVHIPHLQRIAPHEGEEPVGAAVAGGDVLPLAVHVRLAEHRLRPVFLLLPLQLVRHDLGGLVPGDADIFALAPVLGIAFPMGVPVHPLQRVEDAVFGIDPGPVTQAERRDGHALRRAERPPAGADLPGIAVLKCVPLIVIRTDAHHPVVL